MGKCQGNCNAVQLDINENFVGLHESCSDWESADQSSSTNWSSQTEELTSVT